MDDEILKGYPISEFLQSEKCVGWNPDTRRYYANCLQDLLAFTRRHGEPTEQLLTDWVAHLKQTYGRKTVNVHITAANQYFRWCGRLELMRGHIKSETTTDPPTPTVTRAEYLKLLRTARALGKQRTYLLIKLFATTDLPLQCLDQVTAEVVKAGQGTLDYHGVTIDFRCPPPLQLEQITAEAVKANHILSSDGRRTFLLCAELQAKLLQYAAGQGITGGKIFLSSNELPLARLSTSQILQKVAHSAGVSPNKVTARTLRDLYRFSEKAGA